MSDLLIEGGELVFPAGVKQGNCVIQDRRISELGNDSGHSAKGFSGKVLEASGKYVVPGFIDLHVHGGGGADFMDAEQDALRRILAFHAAHGTTGLLATVIPAPIRKIHQALKAATSFQGPGILGIHMEGPFVSPEKSGALNIRWLLASSPQAFDSLVNGYAETIRMVTFAPELPNADTLLERIMAIGAIPSIGHTAAVYDQVTRMLALGASHFTHVPNAMRELHHREPGAVGAALDSDASVELIADGVHVHPAFVRLLANNRGYDRLCLITDAISASGLSDARCTLGRLEVHVQGGIARLADGTLAGSTLNMKEAVRNFMEFTGCSLPEAVRTATLTPARVLGIGHRKGSLELGKDADIVILDRELNIHHTIIGGQVVYARDC